MISIAKLSEILDKISDDHNIDVNLDLIKKDFPEVANFNSKSIETDNLRCLALMSNGERCTRKSKCKKNGLCGIHINMLEKNGNLPNGKFTDNNDNGAIGQSSSNSLLDSSKKSKTESSIKKSQVSKSKKSTKSKIDKDVETEDSEDDLEMDNTIEKSQPEIKTSKTKKSNKKIQEKESLKNSHFLDLETDQKETDQKETEDNEMMIKNKVEKEIEQIVKELINETNYTKYKSFNKKIESILGSKLDSKFLKNSNLTKQLIKLNLEKEYKYYDIKLKEDIEQDKDDSSSDESIECVMIEKDNKVFALDKETSIVYDINTHCEVGKLQNDIIVYLD